MSRKLRWGVISTARIGASAVIPAIHESNNGEVAAVASRDLEKGKQFAAENGIPQTFGSYDEMLADPNIDAIYNPLPNSMHGEWSMRAAEAGKHVLCEKPLANNADEAQQMADLFAAKDLLLAEAFMYRFHPQTEKVKEMVDAGAVGKVHAMQSTFNFSIGSEDDVRLSKELEGGALMDVGCYCLNIIRYLIGEEPSEVRAFADFGERSGVDERLTGILSFPSGAFAHFDCSIRTHFTQTYDIRGTSGRIHVERAFVPFRPDPDAPIIIRYWSSVPGIEKHQYEEIEIPRVNQYTLMVEDFADAVLNNRPPRFPIEDSINNMRAIERLLEAARQ